MVRLKQVGAITASLDIDHASSRMSWDIRCNIINFPIYDHPAVILGAVFSHLFSAKHSVAPLTHRKTLQKSEMAVSHDSENYITCRMARLHVSEADQAEPAVSASERAHLC